MVDPLAAEMGRIDIDKRHPAAATVTKAVTDTKNRVGEDISKEERMKHVELIRKMLVFVNKEFQKNHGSAPDDEMDSEDEEEEKEGHELRKDVEMVSA